MSLCKRITALCLISAAVFTVSGCSGITAKASNDGFSEINDSIGEIVYKDRFYQQYDRIFYEDDSVFTGIANEKLGTAAANELKDSIRLGGFDNNIHYTDFTSNYTFSDVYSVKGVSTKYLLATPEVWSTGSPKYIDIWYSLDGVTVRRGSDLLNPFIAGQAIVSAEYRGENEAECTPFPDISVTENFLTALGKAEPVETDYPNLYPTDFKSEKILVLYLEDGRSIRVNMQENGDVVFATFLFHPDEEAFEKIWQIIK